MEYTKYPTANLSVLQNYHPTHPKYILAKIENPVNEKIKGTGPADLAPRSSRPLGPADLITLDPKMAKS